MQPPRDGDVRRGPLLLAVNIVSFSLAVLVVATRVLFRRFKLNSLGLDDYLIVGGLVGLFEFKSKHTLSELFVDCYGSVYSPYMQIRRSRRWETYILPGGKRCRGQQMGHDSANSCHHLDKLDKDFYCGHDPSHLEQQKAQMGYVSAHLRGRFGVADRNHPPFCCMPALQGKLGFYCWPLLA